MWAMGTVKVVDRDQVSFANRLSKIRQNELSKTHRKNGLMGLINLYTCIILYLLQILLDYYRTVGYVSFPENVCAKLKESLKIQNVLNRVLILCVTIFLL